MGDIQVPNQNKYEEKPPFAHSTVTRSALYDYISVLQTLSGQYRYYGV